MQNKKGKKLSHIITVYILPHSTRLHQCEIFLIDVNDASLDYLSNKEDREIKKGDVKFTISRLFRTSTGNVHFCGPGYQQQWNIHINQQGGGACFPLTIIISQGIASIH